MSSADCSPTSSLDGTRIADDETDLTDGTLQNPIALDEHGAAAPARFLGNSVAACTGTAPLFCFEQ